MNKRFFEGMKTFATVLLVIGLIGSFFLFIFGTFVTVQTDRWSSEIIFNPAGFGYAVGVALGCIALYYLMKGCALIGVKLYADEETPLSQDFSSSSISAEESEATPEELMHEQKITKNTGLIAVIILSVAIAVVIFVAATAQH